MSGIIEVEADEQQTSRGNFSRKRNFNAIVTIKYDELIAGFIAYTEQTNTYKSGFMRGCGYTKSERNANHYKDITEKVKVNIQRLKQFEIIGNVYENSDLVNLKETTI